MRAERARSCRRDYSTAGFLDLAFFPLWAFFIFLVPLVALSSAGFSASFSSVAIVSDDVCIEGAEVVAADSAKTPPANDTVIVKTKAVISDGCNT